MEEVEKIIFKADLALTKRITFILHFMNNLEGPYEQNSYH